MVICALTWVLSLLLQGLFGQCHGWWAQWCPLPVPCVASLQWTAYLPGWESVQDSQSASSPVFLLSCLPVGIYQLLPSTNFPADCFTVFSNFLGHTLLHRLQQLSLGLFAWVILEVTFWGLFPPRRARCSHLFSSSFCSFSVWFMIWLVAFMVPLYMLLVC